MWDQSSSGKEFYGSTLNKSMMRANINEQTSYSSTLLRLRLSSLRACTYFPYRASFAVFSTRYSPPFMPHDLDADRWLKQATRDLQAAEHLLTGDYCSHAIVFAHLAVEKALKAVFKAQTTNPPPVTHDLRHLAQRVDLPWTRDHRDTLDELSDASILSLYAPDAPFGHPVADQTDVARERVSAARMLVGWLRRHVDPE